MNAISTTAYQVTHNHHHYELGRKRDYGTYRQHVRSSKWVWGAYFLQLFLGTPLYIALIPILSISAASARSRAVILVEYGLICASILLLFSFAEGRLLLVCWGCPLIVTMLLTNIRGLGSHALGDVENVYLSSRTIRGSRFVSMILLHENYHLEHHLFPRVPSYNLARLHALIWERLPQALYSRSYSHFFAGFFKAALRNDLRPMGVLSRQR